MCEDDLKFTFWKLRAHLSLCMHIGYAGNNAEHRRDQSWFWFFQGINFRAFFWDFVFSNDFVWNKAISYVIREQVLHIKVGRIFIKRATAYVERFCRRYARKQVIKMRAVISCIAAHEKIFMCSIQTLFTSLTTVLCMLFSINLQFQKQSRPQSKTITEAKVRCYIPHNGGEVFVSSCTQQLHGGRCPMVINDDYSSLWNKNHFCKPKTIVSIKISYKRCLVNRIQVRFTWISLNAKYLTILSFTGTELSITARSMLCRFQKK